jgi:hypothetical protein
VRSTSLTANVFARSVAWTTFVTSMVTLVFHVRGGRIEPSSLGFATISGAALWLALPALRRAAVSSGFTPLRFGRWFLACSTAAAAFGVSALAVTLALLRLGVPDLAWRAGLLGVTCFASAAGVVRMRTWGLLVGGLVSTVLLVDAALRPLEAALPWTLAALPGMGMWLGVAAARLLPGRGDATRAPALESTSRVVTPKVRVATGDVLDLDRAHRAEPDSADAAPALARQLG